MRLAVALTCCILWAAPAALAQQADKVYRLAFLSPTSAPKPGDPATAMTIVPQVLRELGYLEDRNLLVERRFAERKVDRLPSLARELVGWGPDAIVAISPLAVEAARGATRALPIVFLASVDPVAKGWALSLARPGRNVTGIVLASETHLVEKRLEIVKQTLPRATRVALLGTAEPHSREQVQQAQQAASQFGLTLAVAEVQGGDYDRAFERMASDRAEAVVVLASAILNIDRKRIIELAARHRLPAIYQWRQSADDGGLMSYGSSLDELARRLAAQVGRIFKGTRPADLPIEQPLVYELAINLKTARALGISIPPLVLTRADHVVQ
jgi:putative ABC transport system substrate-binding protein